MNWKIGAGEVEEKNEELKEEQKSVRVSVHQHVENTRKERKERKEEC